MSTYKDMVALCNNKVLRHAYFMDYAGWIDLFNEVVSRQEGGYSMFPMEANNFGTDMMQLRYRMLQEEIALKRDGATCQWDTEANKIDWSAENADLLRRWYDRRMKYADNIPDKSFAESFKVMTEKIAYFFLNTLKFGMEGEEDMDDTDD